MEVDLTKTELFDSFTEFQCGDAYIDLHNDFKCKSIRFSNRDSNLKLSFMPALHSANNVSGVAVIFSDCVVDQYEANYDEDDSDFDTIDIMYRERTETQDGELIEISDKGRYYYCINFLPDVKFEVFAKKVTAAISFY